MGILNRSALVTIGLSMSLSSLAACPGDEAVKAYIEDFLALRPNLTFSVGLSIEDAKCARRKVILKLSESLGPIVGYKASFSNDVLRAASGFAEPVWGAMFGKFLTQSPAIFPARYGVGTYWVSGLIVEIKDAGLADAASPKEAMHHISAVIPFIELTDYMSPNVPTFAHYIATNANFRAGVLGEKIEVKSTKEFEIAMASLRVVTSEKVTGVVLNEIKGSDIMGGNVLQAAIWLAKTLKSNGYVLKKGDLLSLGELSSMQWSRPGTRITAKYIGLPNNPSVTIQFD